MQIGKIKTKNDIFLAPMAGYTDIAFRHQCKKYGAGLTTTEMVSAKGLIYDSEKTKSLLYVSPLEDVKIVQLFGHEPQIMFDAIQSDVLNQCGDLTFHMIFSDSIFNHESGDLMIYCMDRIKSGTGWTFTGRKARRMMCFR